MSETNVELARRGWEAATRGELDEIAALLDPEVRWHAGDPNADYACRNRNQALQWMERARERRPLPELVDVRAVGDKVVLVLRPRGEPGAEGEPSLTANVSTFRDGRVVEMVHYDDVSEAFAAVGLEG